MLDGNRLFKAMIFKLELYFCHDAIIALFKEQFLFCLYLPRQISLPVPSTVETPRNPVELPKR